MIVVCDYVRYPCLCHYLKAPDAFFKSYLFEDLQKEAKFDSAIVFLALFEISFDFLNFFGNVDIWPNFMVVMC